MKAKSNISSFLLKKVLVTALICMSFLSCSKDDESQAPVYQEQNPLASYLEATGFNQNNTPFINSTINYEFGLSFKPKVTGKMTTLVLKLPNANPSIRVTIWNKQTGAIVRTATITNIDADTEKNVIISDVSLTKDTEYLISMNAKDWYRHGRNNLTATTYPITAGDISITGYFITSGIAQVIPNQTVLDYYSGDLSFKFIRTE